MSIISDSIEKFILNMLDKDDLIELQRNELAQYFACAPSQINYVLTTRFNLSRGYLIESRRGGGGYIRIRRIDTDKNEYLYQLLSDGIRDDITYNDAYNLIYRMYDSKIVDNISAKLMLSTLTDEVIDLPPSMCRPVRARLLKAMIKTILNEY